MHFSRFLFFSIAAALCHPLCSLASQEVQSQSTLASTPISIAASLNVCTLPGTPAPLPDLPGPQSDNSRVIPVPGGDLLRISADHQERNGSIAKFHGNVELIYRDMHLTADDVDYNDETQVATAHGHVHFESKARDENMYAEWGTYNVEASTGQFYNVHGTLGAHIAGKKLALTNTNPFFFEAPQADRVSESEYLLHEGYVTSCKVPDPIWTFKGTSTEIRPEDVLKIHNGKLRIYGFPIFYTPYFRHTLQRIPRSTGFLSTPTITTSSVKGISIGQDFFWAINRSMDLLVGFTVYTARGFAQNAEYRYRGNNNTYLFATYYGVEDRGKLETNGTRDPSQGGRTLNVQGATEFGDGFRAVANISYLSSFVFRQVFTQAYNEAIGTEVHTTAFVTKHYDYYDFNTAVFRYQNFQSANPGDSIQIRSLPSVQLSGHDRKLFQDVPLYFSFDTAVDALNRSQPGLSTPEFVGRFDVFPRATAAFHFWGFDLVPSLGFRATGYTSSLDNSAGSANERIVGSDRVRTAGVVDVDLRPPALEKIFKSPWKALGDRWKHVIEPRIAFKYVDGIENAQSFILFDDRDIMVNTTQLEVGLTQRLYSKRDSNGDVKELLSWDISQRYYFDPTFGGALIPGQRNVFASSVDFSPYAFLDQARHFSPINSNLRFYPSHRFSVESLLSYDTERHRLVGGSLSSTVRQGKLFATIGHEFVRSSPLLALNEDQMRTTIGYGSSQSLGPNLVWLAVPDLHNHYLQYSAVQASYNLECCGVTAEWRRIALGSTRNENEWRLAISFANVGTFGNIKKNERLF